MLNQRQPTTQELIDLQEEIARGLATKGESISSQRELADELIGQAGIVVFDDCEIPSIDDHYMGKYMVCVWFGNPLFTEAYIWRHGALEELALPASSR